MNNFDFNKVVENFAEIGLQHQMQLCERFQLGKDINEVGSAMVKFMRCYLGDKPLQKHEAYAEIADWLHDSKGKGLYLYGLCSQGKTFMARYVIPAMFHHYHNRILHFYPMTEVNNKLDEVLRQHCIVLDDVGTEEQLVSFGQRRNAFDEIMDAVEQKGKLVIITTNLTKEQIEDRYGTRTYERIKATTRRIVFNKRDTDNHPVSFRE